ncbi:MAG TPA: hypothetical protein VF988_14685 [Verrucomicrobiae bacterium]
MCLSAGVLVAGLLPLLLYCFLPGHVPAWTTLLNEQAPAFRVTSQFEQWLVVSVAFAIKPAYILITSILIIWLWRQKAPDLAALRWGLIAFWLGENACTVNFLFVQGNSDFWEYWHNFGMAVCFSFVTYAVLEGMDRRMIKYSSAKDRCAALSLCRACIKYDENAPCGLRRMFKMLLPISIVLAAMLLTADVKLAAYDTTILGSSVHYSETLADQLFEIRYCPALAILLLAASWLVLLIKRADPVPLAKALFAAAMGPFGFGLMRLFLSAVYRADLIRYVVWEEITELVFVSSAAFVLLVFRHSLFVKEEATS